MFVLQGRALPVTSKKAESWNLCHTTIIQTFGDNQFWGLADFWWLPNRDSFSYRKIYGTGKIFPTDASWEPFEEMVTAQKGGMSSYQLGMTDSIHSNLNCPKTGPYGNLWMRFYLLIQSFSLEEKTWKRNLLTWNFSILKKAPVVGFFLEIKPMPLVTAGPRLNCYKPILRKKGLDLLPRRDKEYDCDAGIFLGNQNGSKEFKKFWTFKA